VTATQADIHSDRILILDFGSQYTQLIARRVREQSVYCEIHPHSLGLAEVEAWNPAGLILSGGPASVLDPGSPDLDLTILDLGLPTLGICYGLQLLAHRLGGLVERAGDHEYGRALLKLEHDDELFADLEGGAERVVWMSHGDRVLRLPDGFVVLGTSESSPFAAVRHAERPIWGVQFHPEFDRQILAEYIHAHRDALVRQGDDPDGLIAGSVETPVGTELLRRFGRMTGATTREPGGDVERH